MSADLRQITETIREMEKSINRIDSRLSRVEQKLFEGERSDQPGTVGSERSSGPTIGVHPTSPPAVQLQRQSLVSLIGRSLIVIGGAYLLRALTDSGAFPIMIGALAGLAYATAFIWRAYRQADSARASATFHGVTAILIAMPLAVETAVSFREMSVPLAFAIILVFSGVVGWISIGAKLRQMAWIDLSITLAALVALLVGSRSFSLGMWSLLVVSIGAMVVADRLENRWFIILPALLTNALVVPLVNLALVERVPPSATVAIITLLGFVAVWTVLVMVDARDHPERPGPFLLMHLALIMTLGVGGGLLVAIKTSLTFLFAPVCAVIAIATGIYAFRMVLGAGDRDRRSVTFVTLTSLLIMAVTGSVLTATLNAVVWLVLAAVSFVLARSGHRLLYESSTLLIIGAAWGAGLLRWIAQTLVQMPDPGRPVPSVAALAVLGFAILFLFTADPPLGRKVFHRWVINAVTTLIIVGSSFALGIHVLQLALPLLDVGANDAGAVASARTIVLSAGSIVLAWLARFPRARTIGSLVNVVLILAAVLIVLINVRVGRAATHFPAFSAYGIALIVAPALKRKSLALRPEDGSPSSDDQTLAVQNG